MKLFLLGHLGKICILSQRNETKESLLGRETNGSSPQTVGSPTRPHYFQSEAAPKKGAAVRFEALGSEF